MRISKQISKSTKGVKKWLNNNFIAMPPYARRGEAYNMWNDLFIVNVGHAKIRRYINMNLAQTDLDWLYL